MSFLRYAIYAPYPRQIKIPKRASFGFSHVGMHTAMRGGYMTSKQDGICNDQMICQYGTVAHPGSAYASGRGRVTGYEFVKGVGGYFIAAESVNLRK